MGNFEENGIEIDGLDEIEVENTSVDDLDSENINLMFLGIDESGSMTPHTSVMRSSLTGFKNGLSKSKEADEILVARADFSDFVKVGGYKKIQEFDDSYSTFYTTSLYDVIIEGAEKLKEYRKFLKDTGMSRVKAVFAIFSDGRDEGSKHSFSEAKRAVGKADNEGKYPVGSLNGEEVTTAFVAFGYKALEEAKNLGFRNILDVYNVKGEDLESKLREAFACLSKSVIESSKNVMKDDDDDFFQV